MQSTVSARLHSLDQQLGCTPFVRNKAGTTLTPAGRQFQKHAGTLVRTVEHARHDVGVPRGFRGALTIGGRFGLWEQLLLRWLPLMWEIAPDISVRAEIGMEPELMQGLVEGRLDIGVMYTPRAEQVSGSSCCSRRLWCWFQPIRGSRENPAQGTSTPTGGRSSTPGTAPTFPTSSNRA